MAWQMAGFGGMATSAGLSTGEALLRQGLQNLFSRAESKKAYERQVHAYKNRYQWTVEDMYKAGLNPALALGASPGGPGVSTPLMGAGTSASSPNLLAMAQVAKLRAEAKYWNARAAWESRKEGPGEDLERVYDTLKQVIKDSPEHIGRTIGAMREFWDKLRNDPEAIKRLERVLFGPVSAKDWRLTPSDLKGRDFDVEVNRPDTGKIRRRGRDREPYIKER